MYRILLVDDEALIREAVSENVNGSSTDMSWLAVVKMGKRLWNL